ncbi:MAG: amino acid ABC transporter permease, partial [Nocardioidaceae bacterium]
ANATHGLRVGRLIASAVVLVLVAQLIHMLLTNDNFQWEIVGDYFFSDPVFDGLKMTMIVAVLAMALGIVLGVVVAVCRLSEVPLLKAVGGAYVWFFRGTPALVQLIFWFNFAALLPRLSLGIPFGPEFGSWSTNSLISAMSAAVIGLGLHEASFMGEIIRGGLLAVDAGQTEAARSLGMGKTRTLFRVILPQAMRSIVPPTGSRSINMVLATSLVSFIALGDLLYTVQSIYNRTFQVIPLLIVAVLWYLIISSVLYLAQSYLERYYGRGHQMQVQSTLLGRTLQLMSRSKGEVQQ